MIIDVKKMQSAWHSYKWQHLRASQHKRVLSGVVPVGVPWVAAFGDAVYQVDHANDATGGQINRHFDAALLPQVFPQRSHVGGRQVKLLAGMYQYRAPLFWGPGAIFNGLVTVDYQPGPGLTHADRSHVLIITNSAGMSTGIYNDSAY